MTMGGQTVGVVTVTLGTADVNGVPAESRTQVNVSGVHFRPLRAEELVGPLSTVTAGWKLTADPDVAVLAAAAADEIVYDATTDPTQSGDTTFVIIGDPLVFTDGTAPFKVTVFCEKRKG